MKILVTGAAGFIGSNLVRHLVDTCSHQVLGYDKLTYAGNLASVQELDQKDQFQFVQGDICDAAKLNQQLFAFQPDAVVNLAAESHVDRSIGSPESFIQTNIVGTYRLLEAALRFFEQLKPERREQFRFCHISTDEVFGSLGPTDAPFDESSRYDPRSPYSASKASSDHLVRAWHTTYGLPTLIINSSNNYGPYQNPEKLVPLVILKCMERKSVPVYGNGENIRDWLHVDDHCRAIEAVVRIGKIGETYGVGGDNQLRNIDLIRMLCDLVNEHSTANDFAHRSLISFVADRPGHDFRYEIDFGKIRNELNWQPQQNIATGMRKTVQWYVENQHWWQQFWCT